MTFVWVPANSFANSSFTKFLCTEIFLGNCARRKATFKLVLFWWTYHCPVLAEDSCTQIHSVLGRKRRPIQHRCSDKTSLLPAMFYKEKNTCKGNLLENTNRPGKLQNKTYSWTTPNAKLRWSLARTRNSRLPEGVVMKGQTTGGS